MAVHKRKIEKRGGGGFFETTRWEDMRAVRGLDDVLRARALEALTTRYWRPVYSFLRCQGHGHEDAQDLTQGFFQEIVLGRALFEKADPYKGRFRTYLLTALGRYVAGEHRRVQARKRAPSREILHLDMTDLHNLPAQGWSASPDRAFTYAWAVDLLKRAMADVEADCRVAGREIHWKVFYERVARPILEEAEPPDLAAVCGRFGIADEKTASNMVVTVKRRFRATIRRLLEATLSPGEDVEGELNELVAILVDHDGAA
jgi:DNA-directed RNA polymerase specialized sigma24 family protein